MPRVAVRGVGAQHQIALLRARRHAGGRAGALHVEDHRRHFGVIRQADELVHQRDAGTRGGCERARTRPARADDHADGRELVLRLEDARERFFLVSGSRRNRLQKPRKPSINDVDGVIGYQAATVAPA